MKRAFHRAAAVAMAAAAATAPAWTSAAAAHSPVDQEVDQDAVEEVAAGPRATYVQPRRRLVTYEEGPNRQLVAGGLLVFGFTYGTSVVVATESRLTSDDWLYVPLAGPWIALADRPPCDTGPDTPTCRGETLDRLALVANGFFQAVGTGMFFGGLTRPGRRVTAEPGVRFSPTAGPTALGLMADGHF